MLSDLACFKIVVLDDDDDDDKADVKHIVITATMEMRSRILCVNIVLLVYWIDRSRTVLYFSSNNY